MYERRFSNHSELEWMDQLSVIQRLEANGLLRLGFDLAFIRNQTDHKLAVFVLDDNVVTIDGEGITDPKPMIFIR